MEDDAEDDEISSGCCVSSLNLCLSSCSLNRENTVDWELSDDDDDDDDISSVFINSSSSSFFAFSMIDSNILLASSPLGISSPFFSFIHLSLFTSSSNHLIRNNICTDSENIITFFFSVLTI